MSIGTLILTQIHLKLGGVRTNLALSHLAAENGLKMAYLFLWEKALELQAPKAISESDWQLLISHADPKLYSWLLCRLFNLEFPLSLSSTWQKMIWKTEVSLTSPKITYIGNYGLAEFLIDFKATGKIEPSSLSTFSKMVAQACLAVGYLPLNFFPLLIEKNLPSEEQINYLKAIKIELATNNKFLPSIKPIFSQTVIISRRINQFLERGLKINLFEPNKINSLILRQVLGLENKKEPVPDGVYLIQDDLGLGGIFVQGDLDKFLLAIEDGYQVMLFQQDNKTWQLRFNPYSGQTIWQTPENNQIFNSLPNEVILVNGNILSFGGKQSDVLISERDLPISIMPGINISLVVSGNINITSSIVQSNLSILPGIPYLQKRQSQIIIFSTEKDLITGEDKEASIIINPTQGNIVIEANLTALGKGLKVDSLGKQVTIWGGIQTTDINNISSNIKIIPPPNINHLLKTENLVPLTVKPMAVLFQLKPIEWKEYERIYPN
ncbi:MAG: hypothetical protein N3B16_03940 [Candidatus Aminicenantes bacterium]|nr:hypothetical protein [Candidatus Aminicenantes bacterium]